MGILNLSEFKLQDIIKKNSAFRISADAILNKYNNISSKAQAIEFAKQINLLLENELNIAQEIANKMQVSGLEIGKDLTVSSEELKKAEGEYKSFLENYYKQSKENRKQYWEAKNGAMLKTAVNSAKGKITKIKGDLAEYYVDLALKVGKNLASQNNAELKEVIDEQLKQGISKSGTKQKVHGKKIGNVEIKTSSSQKADVILTLSSNETQNQLLGFSVKNYARLFSKLHLYTEARLISLISEWEDESSILSFMKSLLDGGRDKTANDGKQILGIQGFMGYGAVTNSANSGTAEYFVFFLNGKATVLDIPSYLKYIMNKQKNTIFSFSWNPTLKEISQENKQTLFIKSKLYNAKTSIYLKGTALQESMVNEYLSTQT